MADGPRAKRSLFSPGIEDEMESDADWEYNELEASLLDNDEDEEGFLAAVDQMSPVSHNDESFLGEDGIRLQGFVMDDLDSTISATPGEDTSPSTPMAGGDNDPVITPMPKFIPNDSRVFTPRRGRSLFSTIKTPRTLRTPGPTDTPTTPGEVTLDQVIVAQTPAGLVRLSPIVAPDDSVLAFEDTVPPTGRRFSFVIWEDGPEDTAPFGGKGAATRERLSRTACLRQSLVCGQVYSSRGNLVSKGLRSLASAPTIIGDGVHCMFTPNFSIENRRDTEADIDAAKNIIFATRVVGRVLISKSQFVKSRTFGTAAFRMNLMKAASSLTQVASPLPPGIDDRRFTYILPVGGERESGFFYINVEYHHRGLGGLTQFPIYSIGFNVRFLAYFVTERGFSQRFNVEISPGLVITVFMEGHITRGLSSRVTRMRSMQAQIATFVQGNTITLSLTSVKIYYPLDWFEMFPNVASKIPGYRRKLIAPLFGPSDINCDMCKAVMNPALKCKGCSKAIYCSKECQVSAWYSGHKFTCKK
jgi:hypothetical protein